MLPTKLVIERFRFKGDLSEINHYMDNLHWINVKGFFHLLNKVSFMCFNLILD